MGLRVLFADDFERPEGEERAAQQLLQREPRLAWTLRQFSESWFLPQVLRLKRRTRATEYRYHVALRYWEDITDDPRLVDLLLDRDDAATIDFVGMLQEWGYSRRGMRRGEPQRIGRLDRNPSFLPLAGPTAHTKASDIATLLKHAGPRYSPTQRSAELLPRLPYVPLDMIAKDFEPKPPFATDEARQIARACVKMWRPVVPYWLTTELWWKVRLGQFYFTGLRAGTVIALRWSYVEERPGGLWLKVPKTAVSKTRKAIELPVHAQLAELLLEVKRRRPRGGRDDDLILPECCGYRHFLTMHRELQEQAGIDPAAQQSPHAWRRTHLTRIAELGAGQGLEFARIAGDHSDGRTTAESYVTTLVNQLRLQLPPLFSPEGEAKSA